MGPQQAMRGRFGHDDASYRHARLWRERTGSSQTWCKKLS